ncbi:negative regulator of differentiation 1 [Fusarium longipes]|uniref:Negative regulator of differentiation 1 n=1 Tax=Fusarium longipes TaxID=694270 RepID=A0A395RG52_9HYPO|nr:negative regulator of differentiation 1 [Fusarium longipes]
MNITHLLTAAHQYQFLLIPASSVCLRQNLNQYGFDDSTLNALCLPTPTQDTSSSANERVGRSTTRQFAPGILGFLYQNPQDTSINGPDEDNGIKRSDNSPANVVPRSLTYANNPLDQHHRGSLQNNKRSESHRRLESAAQRSIQLLNLVPGVTHGDIATIVRGGPLLEIFLRARDNSATVSFVRETDAAAFLEYTQTCGLYFKDRKIHAKWSDYQYVVKGQVAYHIAKGASRNFVIRKGDPNATAQSLRDDLDHIHNLHVIDVEFNKDCCFVNTSSVNSAIFARNCLLSRSEYKNSRIEWVADECAQPLESLPYDAKVPGFCVKQASSSTPIHPSRKNLMGNRFQLLDLSDTEGSNGDDSSDESL